MKKKIVIISSVIVVLLLIFVTILYKYLENKNNKKLIQNNIRYEEIKNAVNKEMERYHYIVVPTCMVEQGSFQSVSDRALICNAGMDREKFLDVDGKNYCDTLTYATCIEKDKWEFETYISCKDYTDKEFVDWDNGKDYCE